MSSIQHKKQSSFFSLLQFWCCVFFFLYVLQFYDVQRALHFSFSPNHLHLLDFFFGGTLKRTGGYIVGPSHHLSVPQISTKDTARGRNVRNEETGSAFNVYLIFEILFFFFRLPFLFPSSVRELGENKRKQNKKKRICTDQHNTGETTKAFHLQKNIKRPTKNGASEHPSGRRTIPSSYLSVNVGVNGVRGNGEGGLTIIHNKEKHILLFFFFSGLA